MASPLAASDSPLTDTPSETTASFYERFYGRKNVNPKTGKDETRAPQGDPYITMEEEAAKHRAREADEAQKSYERQKGLHEEEQKKIGPQYEQLRGTLASPRPAIPETEALPKPPKPEDYQKMGYEFLGAMSVWAAFAGKKGRGVGNAALKGYTAMLNGWHEGNMEAYQNATKQWQQETTRALEMNRQKLEKYRMILADRELSIQDQAMQIKLTASEYQDRIAWDAADQNNYSKIGNILDIGTASQKRAQDAYDEQVKILTAQDEMAQTHANQLRTPEGQAWVNSLPPAQQMHIKGFLEAYPAETPAGAAATAAGTTPAPAPAAAVGASMPTPGGYVPPTEIPTAPADVTAGAPGWTSPIPPPHRPAPGAAQGWTWPKIDYLAAESLRTGPQGMRAFANFPPEVRAAIQQRAAEMAMAAGKSPGAVVAEQAGVKGSMDALKKLKVQEAAIDSYGRNMLRNGDQLLQLAAKTNRTGVPVIQRWLNAGKVAVAGDPDVAEFNLQLRLWIPELARTVTNPNLTGVLTEGARKEMESVIDKGATLPMFQRYMQRAHKDFENRRDTIKQEIEMVEGDISGERREAPEAVDEEGWGTPRMK